MAEHTGWLLDLYADPDGGLAFWLLVEERRERLRFRMDFPVVFHLAGERARLRAAWSFLRARGVRPARTVRQDLFSGARETLAATVPDPDRLDGIVRAVRATFPDLDCYDADIPLALRFAAATGVRLLGRCRVHAQGGTVERLEALESPWEAWPAQVPLRVLSLRPEPDPARHPPERLVVAYERVRIRLDLRPERALLVALGGILRRCDPDLILSERGDDWLFPLLAEAGQRTGLPFNPNRDERMRPLTRRASSYFAYGQVIHRAAQTHLFGRWHIDRRNALLFGEYGLAGVLEQARVTGLGVQEMARRSPGAGITAMQMLTALQDGVLVPLVKQQAETGKSLDGLIRADRGGLIYQPLTGLHADVAQIDFASMYPSIMVEHNISPETGGDPNSPDGLVPRTLRPLLEKRLALKQILLELDPRDCRAAELGARAAALKWLLVVCFGYLGYKNARFGRIEAHEAVTAISRELMLRAKECAEELGFEVLHMYVDSLFVRREGSRAPADFAGLLEAVRARTGIPIALEGVYRWVAFLPSRLDRRVPVPNRYFGVFQDGTVKCRGIEVRRHDTPRWVARAQLGVLDRLARAAALDEVGAILPEARDFVQRARRELRAGRVPLEELLVTQKISRPPEAYRVPSAAARAARQLQAAGRTVAAGQFIRFWHTRGADGVHAAGLGEPDPRAIDAGVYEKLLARAAGTVLGEFEGGKIMLL